MRTATLLDGMKPPPCAELLGWRLIDVRPEEGWVRIGFDAKPEFRNFAGAIQGGILSAMLDDTMGPAVFVMTEGRIHCATIDFNVSFLAPAKVGPIFGEARVIKLGKTVGFVEAYLTDLEGEPIAHATSTVRLLAFEKACA
jgi:uncharacterized protein (TIGR00369 family)